MKNFWRIAPQNKSKTLEMVENSLLYTPEGLIMKLRPQHGIVLADWNEGSKLGEVVAFGIVKSIEISSGHIEAQWARADNTFRPVQQAWRFWRNEKKGFFKFPDNIVLRYALDDLFSEHFPGMDDYQYGSTTGFANNKKPGGYKEIPGFVYVIQSEFGYKIGKTVNLKSRTRLFEVKLPFKIELVHYAWFDNYSKAEREFHDMYAEKRLEGEWFSLTDTDLLEIKKFGTTVPIDKI